MLAICGGNGLARWIGWSPPSGSFDLGSVVTYRCGLASDHPSRMLAFMLIRGHPAQCRRDQGGNNVQRAILALWRRPHGVWGSDIPRVRRRILFSGVRE